MNTIKITKADINEKNEYKGGAIGEYYNHADTHVEIEADLGWVVFKAIYVKGRILAQAGSGIEAGWGIKAGWGIVSLYSYVKAKLQIQSNLKCTISAGIFSTSGAKEIEAQEVIGNVIYGNVKLLPVEKKEEVTEMTVAEISKALGKTVKIV